MLRYIILGMSHPHTAALHASLAAHPEEAVCLGYADTPAYDEQDVDKKIRENLGKASETLTRYENYKDLIALCPDAAVICCDNADCGNIAKECLEAGISVALEKPMTGSLADGEMLIAAAEKSGAKLMVNWPIAGFPAFNKAKELYDEGIIGKALRVVYRSPATWGPYSWDPANTEVLPAEVLGKTWWYKKERGGGSLLDYACYGSALSTWFFGHRAKAVHTVAKNFFLPTLDIEDYSAMLIDFGDGVGLLEGSWSTFNCGEIPSGPIIYGEKGTMVCDRYANTVKVYTKHSHGPTAPDAVYECPKNEERFNFGRDFIDYVVHGKDCHPLRDPYFNLDVMYILDEGLKTIRGEK